MIEEAVADRAACETVRLLAQLGEQVFVPLFVQPSRHRFPRYAENPIEALQLFLYGYAFERQGRSPAYGGLAAKAVEKLSRDHSNSLCAQGFACRLRREFCALGSFRDGKGANPKNNPLWPGYGEGHSSDVVSVAFSSALEPDDDRNLYRFARRCIISDELRSAHAVLQGIRGIGPKIASLYLRDVALDQNLAGARLRDRELLQPIDIWLRRTAEGLARQTLENDKEAARLIGWLADEAGCCALLLNAGSWYFGSQIARTEQSLHEALKAPDSMRCLTEKHRERLCDEAELLRHIDGRRIDSRPAVTRELA